MGIFARLFHQFRNNPQKELANEYAGLHQLCLLLAELLENLRSLQKELLVQSSHSQNERTGQLAFNKGIFVEEELIPKLKELARIAEDRFEKTFDDVHHSAAISPLEENEIKKIVAHLEEIKGVLPDKNTFLRKKNVADKKDLIENAMREVVILSQKFHDDEEKVAELKRKIAAREISPLLRKIFEKPALQKDSSGSPVFTFTVSEKQLRAIEAEAEKINEAQDQEFFVSWQRWWRDIQVPEEDKRTPLKDPHINLTLKLFGKPKKEIHLLVA